MSIFSTRLLNGNDIDIYEDGEESRDFVYIDDVVNATTMALEKTEANNKIFNVGSGNPTSVNKVANTSTNPGHIFWESLSRCLIDLAIIFYFFLLLAIFVQLLEFKDM